MTNQKSPETVSQSLIRSLERVLLKAIVPGQVGWIVLGGLAGLMIWKLDPKDLKEVLLVVLVNNGWVGYVLAAVILVGAVFTFGWREKIYQQHTMWMQGKMEPSPQLKLNLPDLPPPKQLPGPETP